MLSKRQSQILKLIVENYIKQAKPVSSNQLCKRLHCSSATVRNEMASLEEAGLLEKHILLVVEFLQKRGIVIMSII